MLRQHRSNITCCLKIEKYLPRKVRLKQVVRQVHKTHNHIDEALNIIAINNTLLQSMLHDQNVIKYHQALQGVQDNFLIVTKVVMLSRIVKYITEYRNPVSVNVAIYTLISFIIIFASEQLTN
jgi:hypothetical protein